MWTVRWPNLLSSCDKYIKMISFGFPRPRALCQLGNKENLSIVLQHLKLYLRSTPKHGNSISEVSRLHHLVITVKPPLSSRECLKSSDLKCRLLMVKTTPTWTRYRILNRTSLRLYGTSFVGNRLLSSYLRTVLIYTKLWYYFKGREIKNWKARCRL